MESGAACASKTGRQAAVIAAVIALDTTDSLFERCHLCRSCSLSPYLKSVCHKGDYAAAASPFRFALTTDVWSRSTRVI